MSLINVINIKMVLLFYLFNLKKKKAGSAHLRPLVEGHVYCMASRGTVAETKFSVSKGSELVQSWMRCWGASLPGPASLGFVLASASKYALKR